jgi:hypothetical protein
MRHGETPFIAEKAGASVPNREAMHCWELRRIWLLVNCGQFEKFAGNLRGKTARVTSPQTASFHSNRLRRRHFERFDVGIYGIDGYAGLQAIEPDFTRVEVFRLPVVRAPINLDPPAPPARIPARSARSGRPAASRGGRCVPSNPRAP